jgi:hypothetical protein
MKTTIEVPDALAETARRLARDQGTTLRELMVEGLRAELERRQSSTPRPSFRLHTVGGRGLRPEVDRERLLELSYDL